MDELLLKEYSLPYLLKHTRSYMGERLRSFLPYHHISFISIHIIIIPASSYFIFIWCDGRGDDDDVRRLYCTRRKWNFTTVTQKPHHQKNKQQVKSARACPFVSRGTAPAAEQRAAAAAVSSSCRRRRRRRRLQQQPAACFLQYDTNEQPALTTTVCFDNQYR